MKKQNLIVIAFTIISITAFSQAKFGFKGGVN